MRYKDLCYAALGGAVICLLAPISIPAGAVPISLSLLAVLVVAAILPPKLATLSVLCYIALGAIGAPVFAGFTGGFQIIIGPMGGFIIGYIPAALIVSLFAKSKVKLWISMTLSTILCYILGISWFSFSTNTGLFTALQTILLTCAVPDALKIAAASLLAKAINKRINPKEVI